MQCSHKKLRSLILNGKKERSNWNGNCNGSSLLARVMNHCTELSVRLPFQFDLSFLLFQSKKLFFIKKWPFKKIKLI